MVATSPPRAHDKYAIRSAAILGRCAPEPLGERVSSGHLHARIDLSVEGKFNTAKTYKYEINDTNLKMCGKTDYPSRARAITLNRR
jgi:hypothetical protein